MASASASEEAGGKDAGIVHHQQIARPQKLGKIAEGSVAELAGVAIEVQQARGRAVSQRFLRNQLGWKVKIEFRYQHRLSIVWVTLQRLLLKNSLLNP
jgi:hypothetical protein